LTNKSQEVDREPIHLQKCNSAWQVSLHCSGRAKTQEPLMDEETLNLSIRKFLKMVGVRSQREIEQAVAAALASGAIAGTETLAASMTLEVAGLQLKVTLDGDIALQ
jgi:Family of unknown function (DUF6494)